MAKDHFAPGRAPSRFHHIAGGDGAAECAGEASVLALARYALDALQKVNLCRKGDFPCAREPAPRDERVPYESSLNYANIANLRETSSVVEPWHARDFTPACWTLFLAGRKIEYALDAGCGTGYFCSLLQTERHWPIVPMDISWHGLHYAREMGVERRVQWAISPACRLQGTRIRPDHPRRGRTLPSATLAKRAARRGNSRDV